MALPSQAARPQSARRLRYSPRRKPSWGRRVAGLAVLTFIVVAVVMWGPWGGPDAGPDAPPPVTPDNNPALTQADPDRAGERPLPIVNGTHARTPNNPPTRPAAAEPEKKVEPIVDPNAARSAAPDTPEPEPASKDIPPSPNPDTQPRTPASDPYLDKLISQGEAALERNRLLDARDLFNRALHDRRATPAQRAQLRDRISTVNDTLVFSPLVVDADPLARPYTIRPGDSLSRIASSENLAIEWQLLSRINKIADPRRIRVDQQIKLLQGPFHAVVTKNDYRLDLYADKADADGNRLFITSFPVGLGEFDTTPVGSWVVKADSKLINPRWVNPRTGEAFEADDPKNPIGERWIGLTGTDENTELKTGYGIHGTVEPDSIGRQQSMGCVRCLPQHVEVIYEFLVPDKSHVLIIE